MNTVADLLAQQKAQEVVWIEPLANVYDALTLMNERNIGALLVQIDGYLVGIVSERDYVRKVILNRHEAQKLKVSEIMTREVISVTTQDTVIHCINLMKSHHFSSSTGC